MAAGLGKAAAIAGIVSLAGQTVQSMSTLYTFCKTYKNVHVQFEQVGKELEDLRTFLVKVESLTTNETAGTSQHAESFAMLKSRMLSRYTSTQQFP